MSLINGGKEHVLEPIGSVIQGEPVVIEFTSSIDSAESATVKVINPKLMGTVTCNSLIQGLEAEEEITSEENFEVEYEVDIIPTINPVS